MSGGITQLVAIGAQDTYLTGSPQVSFFQSSYKRHTNFSRVTHRQVIQGSIGNNSMTSIKIEHKGDLLNYVYFTKKSSDGTVSQFEQDEIDHVDLLIGGQIIDSQTDDFIQHLAPAYLSNTQRKSYIDVAVSATHVFYPLRFWFCESWASALPLVALQYHDVEIRIYWKEPRPNKTRPAVDPPAIYEAWADFTYLDNTERELFSRPQKVLIYNTQKQVVTTGTNQNLVFNQPVKFLATVPASREPVTPNGDGTIPYSNLIFTDLVTDIRSTLTLQLNGVDVGEAKPYNPHFTCVPTYYTVPWDSLAGVTFLLPFCLDTSKLQPSGQLNFSRLDSARLVCNGGTFNGGTGLQHTDYIYAVSYNVLQFEKGMAGLLYAN